MSEHEPHPKAAPGDLDHLRKLVNTFDVETGEDSLATPDAVGKWLRERGLLKGNDVLTDADAQQLHALREALRKLMLANNGEPLDPHAVDALNVVAKSAELIVRFDRDGSARLAPVRPGFDAALGRLLTIVYRAQADGSWDRMKACGDHSCEWAFYDWSKNRSATWCDMAVCGNRAKARAYRERRQRGAAKQRQTR